MTGEGTPVGQKLDSPIDPVCVFHGKRRSEHTCLVCALCFKDLTPEECSYEPDGSRVDVCIPCAKQEMEMLVKIAQRRLTETESQAALWALDASLNLDRPAPDMALKMQAARSKLAPLEQGAPDA